MVPTLEESDIERIFTAAIDGQLAPSDRQVFEAKLQADAEFRRRFDEYRRAIGLVADLPMVAPPDSLATAILLRARRRRPHLAARQLVELYRVPIEAVTILAIAAIAAVFLWM